jgi:hypothetical protein
MATVSITNQTLTLTIDINGVETVIRKDNCKVVAIGDVVRITDYRGSIYEFLYSDCTAPDEASANDLRDAIEVFLNTAGGGGGGGLSSIESTTLDVSITDGVATVNGISGIFSPTISNIINSAVVDEISGFYSRSGNIVSGVFKCDVSLDAGDNSTSFEFTLPVSTSFANRNQLRCTCNVVTNLVNLVGESVISESKGSIRITAANNGDIITELSIAYQYLIV